MKKTELITVPTFTFNQGDQFIDSEFERPISVDFYDGSIVLRQDKENDIQNQILIHPKYFNDLLREIKRHKKDADFFLGIR